MGQPGIGYLGPILKSMVIDSDKRGCIVKGHSQMRVFSLPPNHGYEGLASSFETEGS
jgi:hypothetical protein